ncbi:MAG: globin domain-containing protein [Bdellovibrionales bacterium]|jgi:hemoglobin-like flavoprotein|nr:globin domain-containing protein [Bdellovibrionales bacterium]
MNFDKEYLQATWNQNLEKTELISEYFYDILFHEYEGTEDLFEKTEMHFQKMEFQKAINHIINNLGDTVKLEQYLKESGIRHVCYGITPIYYNVVEVSLQKTFEKVFQDIWTDDTKKQWKLLITYILDTMKKGAEEVRSDLE